MNEIDKFIQLTNTWGEYMQEGDSVQANRLYNEIQQVFQKITNDKKELILFNQSETVSDFTSFFIASKIKEIDQQRALELYKRLSHSNIPFIAISAKYIIKDIT